MMMSEFIDLLHEVSPTHREPTNEEYLKIEFVYNYHPSVGCKEDIVDLWRSYGNMIIEDMTPRARKIRDAEVKVNLTRAAYEEAKEVYDSLCRE